MLRRHRHLLPARRQRAATRAGRSLPASPRLPHTSPGTKTHLLCVWAAAAAWGARWPQGDGMPQPLLPCLHPLPALPRSQRLRCGWTLQPVLNPVLAPGSASPARGAPAHPISPLGFGVGTDHMKDARPQARADAKPRRPGAGAEVSCSHPIPRAAGHRLGRTQGPRRQGSPGTWLTSACSPASPPQEERAPGMPEGRELPLGCSPTGGSRSRHRGQRDTMGWNHPFQGTQIAPCSPTAGLG